MTAHEKSLGELVRLPGITDAGLHFGSDGILTVVVVPKGLRPGPMVRQEVLTAFDNSRHQTQVLLSLTIPRASDGALDDAAVEAMLTDSPYLFRFQAPSGPIEPDLVKVILQLVPGVQISVTDDLAAIGADSLTSLELSEIIRARFGLDLAAADLYSAASIKDIAAQIQASSGPPGNAPTSTTPSTTVAPTGSESPR